MTGVTLLDLQRMFAGMSSVAVVGNSGDLLGENVVDRINEQDIRVRFNVPPVENYRQWVGSGTDLLFCNAYQTTRQRKCLREISPRAIVCFLSQRESPSVLAEFERFSRGFPVWQTLAPDLNPWISIRSPSSLMTGTYALALLMNSFDFDSYYIAGYNFFGESGFNDHYWDSEAQPSAQYHDLILECQAFQEILASSRSHINLSPLTQRALLGVAPKKGASLKKRFLRKAAWAFICNGLKLRRQAAQLE